MLLWDRKGLLNRTTTAMLRNRIVASVRYDICILYHNNRVHPVLPHHIYIYYFKQCLKTNCVCVKTKVQLHIGGAESAENIMK